MNKHAIGLAGVVDGDDVRMLDGRPRFGLRDEPRPEVRLRRELGRDDLQRDDAVKLQIQRAIDDAHAAAPREPADAVVDEDVADGERHGMRHGRDCHAEPVANRMPSPRAVSVRVGRC